MVGYLRAGLEDQLGRVSWMDAPTQAAAQTKVQQMTQFIAYPHWFTNKTHINEFYNEVTTKLCLYTLT